MNKLAALASGIILASTSVAQDVGLTFTNGVDTYLETPYVPQLVPQAGLTVEAWVTYDDQIATGLNRFPTIVRQNFGGGSESYFLRVNAGTTAATILRFRVSTTAGNFLVDWNFTPGQLNTWTHVAATYDGSQAVLYVNGTRVSSLTGNGLPVRDLGGPLRVGKGADSSGPYEVWNGEIDELRIWPFARTEAEIRATMMQKLISVPGLVETWNFDNSFVDSSSGIALAANGSVAVGPNSLTFSAPALPSVSGQSTAGCLGDVLLSPSTAAQVRNAEFAAVCTQTPPSAAALWLLTGSTLPSPLPFLGVNVWVNPAGSIAIPAAAASLGALRLGLPIPAGPVGGSVALQAFVLDPCGSQGLTASNAMTLAIVP
ncbi:MAG: LamG domain-containing protein [Planctomycetota bacterium]